MKYFAALLSAFLFSIPALAGDAAQEIFASMTVPASAGQLAPLARSLSCGEYEAYGLNSERPNFSENFGDIILHYTGKAYVNGEGGDGIFYDFSETAGEGKQVLGLLVSQSQLANASGPVSAKVVQGYWYQGERHTSVYEVRCTR